MTNEEIIELKKMITKETFRRVKYSGWRYKISHGPTFFFGCSKERVRAPDGTERFAAVVLVKTRGLKGKKCRVPARVEFFDRQREASETALLWCCCDHGVEIPAGCVAGSVSREQRLGLLRELGVGTHRSSLVASSPTPEYEEVDSGSEQVDEAAEQTLAEESEGGSVVVGDHIEGFVARPEGGSDACVELGSVCDGVTNQDHRFFARVVTVASKIGGWFVSLTKGSSRAQTATD